MDGLGIRTPEDHAENYKRWKVISQNLDATDMTCVMARQEKASSQITRMKTQKFKKVREEILETSTVDEKPFIKLAAEKGSLNEFNVL